MNNITLIPMNQSEEVKEDTKEWTEIESIESTVATDITVESRESTDEHGASAGSVSESPETAVESKVETPYKHIVLYIANGVWIDSKGEVWHKNHTNPEFKSERRYTDDEFETREDIKFMIKYGSMQHFKI